MLRLKATKTTLYKLVASFEPLYGMNHTVFYKVPRHPSYFLDWRDDDGEYYRAYFSACLGQAILTITKRDIDGRQLSRQVHCLSIQELRECGMIEEVADG